MDSFDETIVRDHLALPTAKHVRLCYSPYILAARLPSRNRPLLLINFVNMSMVLVACNLAARKFVHFVGR